MQTCFPVAINTNVWGSPERSFSGCGGRGGGGRGDGASSGLKQLGLQHLKLGNRLSHESR